MDIRPVLALGCLFHGYLAGDLDHRSSLSREEARAARLIAPAYI
jgi:hypothetical protein